MTIKEIAILMLTVLAMRDFAGSGVSGPRSSEQLHFSAEDVAVENPVAIPPAVLTILTKDNIVENTLGNENISPENIPASWFSASEVHLSTIDEVDLVVMAGGPLRGSNVTTFWVFTDGPHGYTLVLTVPAHDLTVTKSRWKGHREINAQSITAVKISTTRFRFNGTQYAEYSAKSEHIQ